MISDESGAPHMFFSWAVVPREASVDMAGRALTVVAARAAKDTGQNESIFNELNRMTVN